MLDQITYEQMKALEGTSAWLHAGATGKVEMRIVSVAKVMESDAARLKRTPFSMYFVAPLLVPQHIYRVTHEAFTEPLDIFLVPIGRDADGYSYEAVFT